MDTQHSITQALRVAADLIDGATEVGLPTHLTADVTISHYRRGDEWQDITLIFHGPDAFSDVARWAAWLGTDCVRSDPDEFSEREFIGGRANYRDFRVQVTSNREVAKAESVTS